MPTRRLFPALLAASLAAGCAEQTAGPATSGAPLLQLSATSLAFQVAAGGSAPAAQTVTVTNAGGGQLAAPEAAVSYTSGSGWLAAAVSGTAAPYTVTVQATVAALAEGTYRGRVTLASAGASNSPRTVEVTLTVLAPPKPAMQLSATALQFQSPDAATVPAAQVVTVTALSPGTLAAPAATIGYASGSGWLTAQVTGTAPPYTVTVQANPAGLALGTYEATVELATASASNSPRSIAVTLLVGRPVLVSRLVSWWGEDGTATQVADPSVQSITLTQDVAGGGTSSFTAVPGSAAGTWVAAAGPGTYLLTITWSDGSRSQLGTAADAVDLGVDRGGRPGRVEAALSTQATLDVLGLDGWLFTEHLLQLHSWDAQAATAFDYSTLPLYGGETELLGFTFDWLGTMDVLLTASDVTRVLQVYEQSNYLLPGGQFWNPIFFRSTARWTSLTGLGMSDGVAVTLAPAAMSAPGATAGQLALDWRKPEFEAALPAFSRSTDPQGHRVGVYALPAPLTETAPLGALGVPLLETASPALSYQGEDTNCGTLPYPRFLPATFAEVVHASFAVPVVRKASTTAGAVPGLANVVSRYDEVAAAPVPVAPLVGGVQAPTIDGQDALVTRTVASATPTLAWQAPLVGTPTSYRVLLYRLAPDGAASRATFVAEAVLDGATTTFAVPAGLLTAGGSYAAQIAARVSPTDAGGASPWRAGVPFGEAAIWTERFSIP